MVSQNGGGGDDMPHRRELAEMRVNDLCTQICGIAVRHEPVNILFLVLFRFFSFDRGEKSLP